MKKGYVVIETEAINSGRCGTSTCSKICNSQVYFDKKKGGKTLCLNGRTKSI